MSDSNDWIREVNGKVDHGIMTFDFFKTNEAFSKLDAKKGSNFLQLKKSAETAFKNINSIFYALKKTKNINIILAMLKSSIYMDLIFCKLEKAQKNWISFFATVNFKKLKKHEFTYFIYFLNLFHYSGAF